MYVIGDVKNIFNSISFIKNENRIKEVKDNFLSFLNFGTQNFIQSKRLNSVVVHPNYIHISRGGVNYACNW